MWRHCRVGLANASVDFLSCSQRHCVLLACVFGSTGNVGVVRIDLSGEDDVVFPRPHHPPENSRTLATYSRGLARLSLFLGCGQLAVVPGEMSEPRCQLAVVNSHTAASEKRRFHERVIQAQTLTHVHRSLNIEVKRPHMV